VAKGKANPNQFDMFGAMPAVDPTVPASLAGSPYQTARAVGEILKDDPRSRDVIAAEMTVLLDQEVSKAMLDAYASPGRDGHNISFDRMKALIVVTGRIDILRRELRAIGVSVVDGNGLMLAEIGHIDREIAAMTARKKMLQSIAQPVGEATRK